MIVICAWCKEKEKTPDKSWQNANNDWQLVVSISISHGICPDCKEKFWDRSETRKVSLTLGQVRGVKCKA